MCEESSSRARLLAESGAYMSSPSASSEDDLSGVDVGGVMAARRRLTPFLEPTPTVRHPLLDRALGCEVWVKLENTQPLGAFKIRGGLNLLASLDERERARGVVAATRGNHGQSLAHACARFSVPCALFVPRGNNPEKNASMRALGARVAEAGDSFDDACAAASIHAERTGARLVHPGREPALVEGIGTLFVELIEQCAGRIDELYVPVGVGSCLAAAAIVCSRLSPSTRLIGVASAAAPAMARAFASGTSVRAAVEPTLADGLAVGTSVEATLAPIRRHVSAIELVSEAELASAIRLYAGTIHQLAEGAGAAALAGALRRGKRPGRIGVVLSGGNIDAATLRGVLSGEERRPIG